MRSGERCRSVEEADPSPPECSSRGAYPGEGRSGGEVFREGLREYRVHADAEAEAVKLFSSPRSGGKEGIDVEVVAGRARCTPTDTAPTVDEADPTRARRRRRAAVRAAVR